MTTVYLYGGIGTFTGGEELQWESPSIGSRHKFILFMAQEFTESKEDDAHLRLKELGFTEMQLNPGKPIAVEALNEPAMQAFQKHYEGALAEGFSLVWYP